MTLFPDTISNSTGFTIHAMYGKSQRGAPMLIHEGHTYVKDRQFLETTNWRCSLFKKLKCRARAVTKDINGVGLVKFTNPLHSHGDREAIYLQLKKDDLYLNSEPN